MRSPAGDFVFLFWQIIPQLPYASSNFLNMGNIEPLFENICQDLTTPLSSLRADTYSGLGFTRGALHRRYGNYWHGFSASRVKVLIVNWYLMIVALVKLEMTVAVWDYALV